MKLGLYFAFRRPPEERGPWTAVYREALAQIELAEELGFDAVWLTEHHFVPDGYSPSVLPIAAAVAARTRRLDVGTFVALVPFYHPVRLAEDATTVDLIAEGRFILGLSAGYRQEELDGYGMSWDERPGRVDESLEVLRRCWTEDDVDFDGRFFTLKGVSIYPKPVSQPHPRVYYGGVTPAGRRRGALFDANRVRNIALRWLYVGETEEQAWEDWKGPASYVHRTYRGWAGVAAGREAAHASVWEADVRRDFVAGTPDQVVAAIEAARCGGGDAAVVAEDSLGEIEHLVIGMALPGLPPEKVERSMRLFARDVMPRLSTSPPEVPR